MPAYYYPAAVVAPAVPCVTPTAVVPVGPPVIDPLSQPGIDSGLLSLYKNYKNPSSPDVLKYVKDASAKDLYDPIAQHLANPDAACSNHGIVAELRPNGKFICKCDLGWISEDCSVPLKNWGAFRKCSSNKPGQCDEGMECATWSLVDLGEVNRCVCSPGSKHRDCPQPTGNLGCGGGDECPKELQCTSYGYCGCPPYPQSSSNPLCQCAGSIPDPSNGYTLVQCKDSPVGSMASCQAVSAVPGGQKDACNAYLPIYSGEFLPGTTGFECDKDKETALPDKTCVLKPVLRPDDKKKKTKKTKQ